MDTSVMEYTAEDLISHKLLRGGILVAKPKFDQGGADLLALLEVNDGAKFCRIQCKGRSLLRSPSASVNLLEKYVTTGLVLFLFLETGESKATHLYCFFAEDIREHWPLNKGAFTLSISLASIDSKLSKYAFSDDKVDRIKQVIRGVDSKQEFRRLLEAELSVVEVPDVLVASASSGLSASFSSVENSDTFTASASVVGPSTSVLPRE